LERIIANLQHIRRVAAPNRHAFDAIFTMAWSIVAEIGRILEANLMRPLRISPSPDLASRTQVGSNRPRSAARLDRLAVAAQKPVPLTQIAYLLGLQE
jgi:hypothetical protein